MKAFALGFQIPDGVFERGLGHTMTADKLEDRWDFSAVLDLFGCSQRGSKLVKEDVPGGVSGFVGKVRMLTRGAFAPAGKALGMDFREQHAAVARHAEAGFKRTK